MSYKHKTIEITRIAVGIQSNDNAPSEYWHPSEFEPDLPDGTKLQELLAYAKRKLRGRPICICIAIIYQAPGVTGKQLNRRASVETGDNAYALELLRDQVMQDCVEDAAKELQASVVKLA